MSRPDVVCSNQYCKLRSMCAREGDIKINTKSRLWRPSGMNCSGYIAKEKPCTGTPAPGSSGARGSAQTSSPRS